MTFTLSLIGALQEYSVMGPDGQVMAAGSARGISFSDMGFMAWPITFCALMVLILAARAAWRLRSAEPEQSALLRSTIDGSLFWGAYAAVLGVLGTVIGFMLAAQSVEAVGLVETTLVWGGVKIALSTTAYGLLIFLVASLMWFGLRQWHRRAVLGGV